MPQHPFEPKLISSFREGYSLNTFFKDCVAGIIVGIVALPLSIAFAIASGVKPEQGLYTAIIAGFIISILSGSRYQIGGPTGAFIVIVYSIVQKFGYDGLVLATIMAGVFLIIMGLARLGEVIKFIPYPVTVGFTSGIALIIFSVQVKDLFGLKITNVPDHFFPKWVAYFNNWSSFHPASIFIGILTVLLVLIWPKITRKLPSPLVALAVSTFLVHYFQIPIDTVSSRFGHVPNTFVPLSFPQISIDRLIELSSPALAIALLGGIESLLSAVVADGMTGRKHRSNMELIAQGTANIITPLFGGIPATGAIARTATNIKSGGQTPISGIVHALTVLAIFLFFGPWAGLIPMAALAGILIVVAYNMSEWRLFVKLLKSPKSDVAVLLTTFMLTVFIDLIVAIEVGVVMASFLFMRRMVEVTKISSLTRGRMSDDDDIRNDPSAIAHRQIPPGVEVFEIDGPFFFGAADKFRDTLREIKKTPKVLILRMRHVPTIDATGLRALEDTIQKAHKEKMTVILSAVNEGLRKRLDRSDLTQMIGQENFVPDIDAALERARQILNKQ